MEMRELRSFVALWRHAHYGKAAQELGLSQPALSLHIQSLEKALKTPLLVRRPGSSHPLRPLQFTLAGEELRERAWRIVQQVDAASLALQELRFLPTGPAVRVAITPEYREPLVAAISQVLRKKLEVVVDEGKTIVQIEQGIRDGAFHLGVVTAAPTMIQTVTAQPEGHAPLEIIVNKKHRLATSRGTIDIRTLARERFVLPAYPSLERTLLDEFFQKLFVPRIAVETNGRSALAYVRANPSLITMLAVPLHVDRQDLAVLSVPRPGIGQLFTYMLWSGTTPRTHEIRVVASAISVQLKKLALARFRDTASRP